tara:strand:+ start:4253 stop:4612 length:360 start_codon:yes stop_codon:yes gene_type:complete
MPLKKDFFDDSNVGSFLLWAMILSQTAITVSVMLVFIYGEVVSKGETAMFNTFSREVKPIQMLMGALFFLWWIRSNDWNEKTLPINPKIRMIIFQYAIVCIYIAFDLIIQYWKDPEIKK